MFSTVSLAAGPTTRTWHIRVCGRPCTVQLYHNTITGERALSLDGSDVPGTAGSSTVLGGRKVLIFSVGGVSGEVAIAFEGMSVTYSCRFDGEPVPEENALLGGSHGAGSNAGADETEEAALGRLKIAVDAADVAADETGKPVVWFKVHTVREADEREVVVHRRFRDFFANNEALRSAYKGSHLLAALPELPPRTLAGSLFSAMFGSTDHLDPAFINERRFKLQDYLFKMANVPRMRGNPDFLVFLGMVDSVREVSVLFPPGAVLGLSLKAAGDYVEVTALKPLADGSKSAAQASGLVKAGDKLSKVNGESVLGEPYEVVVAKLKSLPRPLVLHFLGNFPAREAGPGDGSHNFEHTDLRAPTAHGAAAVAAAAAAKDAGASFLSIGVGGGAGGGGGSAGGAGGAGGAAGLFDAGGLC